MNTIYPVVLAVPQRAVNLKGREKVTFLSQYARRAVEISARHHGICLGPLLKDDKGAPLPFQGNYWSVTHKSQYVGGVVAPRKIGIDIEKIRSVSEGLFEKTAHDSEWNLAADPHRLTLFFRFWTAKEAVLKAAGVGIAALMKCRVVDISNSNRMILDYQNRFWHVEHFLFEGHIAAIVQNDFEIKWMFCNFSKSDCHENFC